jgi:hypothetical protein
MRGGYINNLRFFLPVTDKVSPLDPLHFPGRFKKGGANDKKERRPRAV